jgi:hypothetical protein
VEVRNVTIGILIVFQYTRLHYLWLPVIQLVPEVEQESVLSVWVPAPELLVSLQLSAAQLNAAAAAAVVAAAVLSGQPFPSLTSGEQLWFVYRQEMLV